MSFGASSNDTALRAAWQQFCTQLQAAGEQAFKDSNPANALQRADAFRFLTQNLGQAFDLALETKDTRYPALHRFCGPTRKLGGDAADLVYHQAWIDGESVYRLHGRKGTARFLNFTVQGPRPAMQPGTNIPSLHEPFGDIPEANLFGHQLQTDSDGNFELIIGGERRETNWLPTTPGSRKLFIRQGFDRWDETPAQLFIERIGMEQAPPLPTPQTMIAAMDWAGAFVTGLMHDWPDHPYRYGAPVVDPTQLNRFPVASGGDGADAKRGRAVTHLCWALAPDEALIIEFDAHDGFWMVTNSGMFFNSMDYRYRPISYTPSRTTVDTDGKIRLILSHDDSGYHNWLDTQGFARGNLTYRCFGSAPTTTFRTRLIKRDALEAALPSGSKTVSGDQRVAQMHERLAAIQRRYAGL
ncbi:DUF1214 domain-containing protein [Solimonas terrae]|uniref:DUF1214 domain-containing protein n=1 Tax=Solimonas terrae TaxID=1396819 RepID=A0A6M2BP66_9GAMM|nr:DUF1214 domain-containing protein [Solimonas terrae]NGY04011.1 DUF1214 domain-containing protein [Solimonas terrae]